MFPSGASGTMISGNTIALALGQEPLWNQAEKMSSLAGEFYQIGDCKAPRGLAEANAEGWTAARSIGKI